MNAGKLRNKVTILRKSTVKNDFGEEIETYTPIYNLRAQIIYLNGKKYVNNSEIFNEQTLKVVTYIREVKTADILEFKGVRFRIIDVTPDVDFIHQTITAEKIND